MHVWQCYRAIESVWARENFFHKHTLSESYRENTHTYICTRTRICTNAHTNTHLLSYTRTHTYTHTHKPRTGWAVEGGSEQWLYCWWCSAFPLQSKRDYVCFSGKWKCTAKALRALCWWRRGGRGKGVCGVYKKGVFIWTPVNALGLCRGGHFVAVVWTCFAQTYLSFAQIFDSFSGRSLSNQNIYVR